MEPKTYLLYRIHLNDKTGPEEELAGKYVIMNGVVTVLEDHFHVLAKVKDAPMDETTRRYLSSLNNSPYYKVVDADSFHHMFKDVPEYDFEAEGSGVAPSSFEYVSKDGSHLIEFKNGKVFLNGTEISLAEAGKLLEHNAKGIATIKYKVQ